MTLGTDLGRIVLTVPYGLAGYYRGSFGWRDCGAIREAPAVYPLLKFLEVHEAGILIPRFAPYTSYYIFYPENRSSVTVKAEPSYPLNTVNGTGVYSLFHR